MTLPYCEYIVITKYCTYKKTQLISLYLKVVYFVHFLCQCTQFYFTNQMHNIHYILILKAYLRHVSVQVYHLQGEQNIKLNVLLTVE
jgi:hypothetical protein